jgi:uncharacterized protein (TIGR02145 family)
MKKQLTKLALTATLGLAITFTFTACEEKEAANIKDSRDGKTYKTVKIGEQVWMAENLNIEMEGSKCYDNNQANCQKYGRLYDWNTATKACPSGWHLPSREELDKLVNFAGGVEKAGKYLKATSGWNNDYEGKSGNGEDKFGFSALPSGFFSDGDFGNVGEYGSWWYSSEGNDNTFGEIRYYDTFDYNYDDLDGLLRSVRCIKD